MTAHSFPNETAQYREARNRLLQQEVQLREMTENVARQRRALPLGGEIPEDYIFHGDGPVKLSELFEPGKNTLAIYSYMFGPDAKTPCMMCTPILDALNGQSDHIRQRISFAVVAESSPERLRNFKHARGWDLRLLSAAGTTYNKDYYGKDEQGRDDTMMNIFHKVDGKVYHFWGSELSQGPKTEGMDHRSLDAINPLFNFLDLSPEGRGDFYPRVAYPF